MDKSLNLGILEMTILNYFIVYIIKDLFNCIILFNKKQFLPVFVQESRYYTLYVIVIKYINSNKLPIRHTGNE
jgi:hypothetical protein